MNALRNKVSLIGRLGAQPEVLTLKTGRHLAKFSIAVNEPYKDKQGDWQEQTQWHNVTAWGKTAERVAALLEKGQQVLIEGRLENTSYENKEGEKKYGTNIVVREFLMLKNGKDENK